MTDAAVGYRFDSTEKKMTVFAFKTVQYSVRDLRHPEATSTTQRHSPNTSQTQLPPEIQ